MIPEWLLKGVACDLASSSLRELRVEVEWTFSWTMNKSQGDVLKNFKSKLRG